MSPPPAAPARPLSEPDTRQRLLAAALELFTGRGYDGASIRAITSRARANLAAVTYHFGSKAALYESVVESVVSPLREAVAVAAQREGTALERVEGVVRAFFGHLRGHPEMPQLMMQRLAAGQPVPRPAAVTIQYVLGTLVSLIREGQAGGTIRPGDPPLLALSVIAQPLHLSLAGRALREVGVLDLADPERYGTVVEHAAAFVRSGLAAEEER